MYHIVFKFNELKILVVSLQLRGPYPEPFWLEFNMGKNFVNSSNLIGDI